MNPQNLQHLALQSAEKHLTKIPIFNDGNLHHFIDELEKFNDEISHTRRNRRFLRIQDPKQIPQVFILKLKVFALFALDHKKFQICDALGDEGKAAYLSWWVRAIPPTKWKKVWNCREFFLNAAKDYREVAKEGGCHAFIPYCTWGYCCKSLKNVK